MSINWGEVLYNFVESLNDLSRAAGSVPAGCSEETAMNDCNPTFWILGNGGT